MRHFEVKEIECDECHTKTFQQFEDGNAICSDCNGQKCYYCCRASNFNSKVEERK
jgi:hypothetical protein